MPWVRLDEHFPEHRKILAVGGDAAWLHVCALAYAARNLTDGHIPAAALTRLSDRRNPSTLASRLVDVGIWHPSPDGDGWQIHDFLDYQPSAAKVRETRDAAAERQRRAREAAAARRSGVTPMSQRDSQRDMPVSHAPPDPTRPEYKPQTHRARPSPNGTTPTTPAADKRPQDELWDALTDELGPATTPTERTNRGRTVKELTAAQAHATDVHTRCHEYRRRFPGMALTDAALRKHWTALATSQPPPPPRMNPSTAALLRVGHKLANEAHPTPPPPEALTA